jgi:hypothetical protein
MGAANSLSFSSSIVVNFSTTNTTEPVMPQPSHRPEDRQRSGGQDVGWAETEPLCFRSEAFAEDLGVAELPPAPQPVAQGLGPVPRRLGPQWVLSLASLLVSSSH